MSKELWLPTTTTHVQVDDHNVRIWDAITFEKRKVKTPVAPSSSTQATVFKNERGR